MTELPYLYNIILTNTVIIQDAEKLDKSLSLVIW